MPSDMDMPEAAGEADRVQQREAALAERAKSGTLLDDTPFFDRLKQIGGSMRGDMPAVFDVPRRRIIGFSGVVRSLDAAGVLYETAFEAGLPPPAYPTTAELRRDDFQSLVKAATQDAYDRAERGGAGRTVQDILDSDGTTPAPSPAPGLSIRDHIDAALAERESGMLGAREAAIADLEGQVTAVKESGIYRASVEPLSYAAQLRAACRDLIHHCWIDPYHLERDDSGRALPGAVATRECRHCFYKEQEVTTRTWVEVTG